MLLAKADRALERGSRDRAARRARAALRLQPESSRALLLLARATLPREPVLKLTSAETSAIKDLLRRSEGRLGQLSMQLRYWVAWAHALRDDLPLAAGLVQAASRGQDPDAVPWLKRISILAVWRGDHRRAEALLRMAIRLAPEHQALRSDLAILLLVQGRTEASLDLLRSLLARHPESLSVRRDLAGAWLASGRPDRALALLRGRLGPCLASPGCSLELAQSALLSGDPSSARIAARRVLDQAPTHRFDAAMLLGRACRAADEPARAVEAYGIASRARPSSVLAREALEYARLALPSQDAPAPNEEIRIRPEGPLRTTSVVSPPRAQTAPKTSRSPEKAATSPEERPPASTPPPR